MNSSKIFVTFAWHHLLIKLTMWKSRLEHSARKEILAYVGMHKKYFLDIFVDTGLGIAEDSSSIEEFRLSSYSPSV